MLIFYFIGVDRLAERSKKRTVGESSVKEEKEQYKCNKGHNF